MRRAISRTDNEARLYVADSGNNRILIFDQINLTPTTGAHATFILTGLSQPRGVFVNQVSSEMWVAEGAAGMLKRYPRYANLILNSAAPNCNVSATAFRPAATPSRSPRTSTAT